MAVSVSLVSFGEFACIEGKAWKQGFGAIWLGRSVLFVDSLAERVP